MTFNEIGDMGANPVIEISQQSGESIYVMMITGMTTLSGTIPFSFVQIVNFIEWQATGATMVRRGIELTEDDIKDASFVRLT